MGWSLVLGWLGTTREQMAARKHYIQLGTLLFFLGAVVFTLFQLHTAWATYLWFDWMDVWVGLIFTGILAINPLLATESWITNLRRNNAQALRAGAAAGNDDLAPIATHQPDRLPDVERAFTYTHVDHVNPVSASQMQSGGALLTCKVVVIVLIAFFQSLTAVNHPQFALTFIYLGLASVFLARDLVARRPITVTADAQSFTWNQTIRHVTVAWHDVLAFCRIERSEPLTNSWGTVYYLVVTEQTVLQWQRPVRKGAKGYDEAEQLASLVATYCGHPLRDISREVSSQAQIAGRRGKRGMFGTPMERSQLAPTSRWWNSRTRYLVFTALMIEAMLITLCVGALHVQPAIYARCLAQAQAHRPLFTDALTANDGRWPVYERSVPQGSQIAYVNGSYTLTNGQDYRQLSAWTSQVFSDATVEVTVRQISSFHLGEAGLILRADDATHTLLVLTVVPEGELWLYSLSTDSASPDDKHNLIIESSDAIVKGNDATNRIQVIMRGADYTIYFNGQLAGAFHEDGPTSGHVGVYVDLTSESDAFNDFAVYPAPPSSCSSPL